MISAKKISIEGLCRQMGIDPSGAVDFVNMILSDYEPVTRLEDLSQEAYQALLTRFREMKREQEKEKDRNRLKVVLSGTPTPEQEKRRVENNDRIMEEWRAKKYAGMTPDEIKAKKKADFERLCENSKSGSGGGLWRKGCRYDFLSVDSMEDLDFKPMTPEQVAELHEKRKGLKSLTEIDEENKKEG